MSRGGGRAGPHRQLWRVTHTHWDPCSLWPAAHPASGTNGSSATGDRRSTPLVHTHGSTERRWWSSCTVRAAQVSRWRRFPGEPGATGEGADGLRKQAPLLAVQTHHVSRPVLVPAGLESHVLRKVRRKADSPWRRRSRRWGRSQQLITVCPATLTQTLSLRLSPRPVRTAGDELEALQLQTSVALELLVLAKVVVLLCFLQEGKT